MRRSHNQLYESDWRQVEDSDHLYSDRRTKTLRRAGKKLPPITQQMLTKQVRKMERDQLVARKVYEVIPPRVEYSLTKFGRSLGPAMRAWCTWVKANTNNSADLRQPPIFEIANRLGN